MKFVSVLGYDRSGTTFLGSYLSYYGKNVFYAGEIDKGLEHYFKGNIKKCTCGKPYDKCSIWGEILPKLDENNIDFKFIFSELERLTQADLIIDSSKTKSYVRKFKEIFEENHFTLFVIRNPKGVALSRMKSRKKRVKKGTHPKPYIAKMHNTMLVYDSIEWNNYNKWATNYIEAAKNLNIIYEEMAEQLPEKLLSFMKDILGVEVEEGLKKTHIIWGNKGRTSFNPNISVNEKWKTELNYFQRKIVDIITNYREKRVSGKN